MFDNTFCSSDPDKYYEVNCPVNYFGVSNQLKWYISSINTVFIVEMFSPDDYITFLIGDEKQKINLEKSYKNRDDTTLLSDLIALLEPIGISLSCDDLDRYKFFSSSEFSIVGISYALQQALGFYYIKDIDESNPLVAVEKNNTYIIQAKAFGYSNLTPIWYLLSNLGSPNLITSMYSPYEMYYPSIAMKIMNQFSPDQFIQYSNSDFMSISQASALSNLRVKLVDINLKPVKLLSPLVVTVSFMEMAEEQQAVDEAMAEVETNQELIESMTKRKKDNYVNLVKMLNKRLKGVAEDTEDLPAPEESRGNEMAENVQMRNAVEEQKAEERDIKED